MAKRFKLKFPNINIPSFQFCRPKCSSSSLPKNPIPKPAKYRLSPVSPKSYEITYPSSSPAPPPSTPDFSLVSSSPSEPPPPKSVRTRSSNGCDSISEFRRSRAVKAAPSSMSKKKMVKKSGKPSHVFTLISSDEDEDGDEEEDDNDDDDDSLVLLDSSRSFSSEQFYPRGSSQRHYRASRGSPPVKATAERKKARESVAVVKRSEDPYEDFKRSMLEMIMEKQMFRVVDLEELLQCFLTLNSKQYHGIIVEAFSEIWEILFSDYSTLKHRLSS